LLRTGRWEGELEKTKADGSRVFVASRWSLRQDEEGAPSPSWKRITTSAIGSIGRRKSASINQELEKRTSDLEASNKELEAFAYSVSHDLRAPLRHMVGYTELLQKNVSSMVDEKSLRYMKTILDSAKRMGALIDDLLAFSSIARAETRQRPVNLDELVKEVLQDLQRETEGRILPGHRGPCRRHLETGRCYGWCWSTLSPMRLNSPAPGRGPRSK